MELVVFGGVSRAEALVALPGDKAPRKVVVRRVEGKLAVATDPFAGRVRWTVSER